MLIKWKKTEGRSNWETECGTFQIRRTANGVIRLETKKFRNYQDTFFSVAPAKDVARKLAAHLFVTTTGKVRRS